MLARVPAIVSKAFSPLDIGSSLLSWWTAGRGISVNWTDVKAGRVMTVSGATWGATSFNGAPGWTFDGVDDYMNLESQPFPSGAAPVEIFAVFQQNAVDTASRSLFGYGGSAGSSGRSLQRISGNKMRANVGTGGGTAAAEDATNLVTSRHVVHGIWTETDVSISVDGNAYVTTAAVPATDTLRVRIGSSLANTPAGFFSGVVSDVSICGPLSTGARAAMVSHLMKLRRV